MKMSDLITTYSKDEFFKLLDNEGIEKCFNDFIPNDNINVIGEDDFDSDWLLDLSKQGCYIDNTYGDKHVKVYFDKKIDGYLFVITFKDKTYIVFGI